MSTDYKIGYIDENQNSLDRFGRFFENYFEVFPAKPVAGMTVDNLLEEVFSNNIDLLIIDYDLKETGLIAFNGDEIEDRMYELKPQFPCLIFTSHKTEAENDSNKLKKIFDKNIFPKDEDFKENPESSENVDFFKFLDTLKKSIEYYKDYVNEIKTNLESLVQESETRDLSRAEKEKVFQLHNTLQNLDKTVKVSTPPIALSFERAENQSVLIEKAEALIQKLSI